MNGFPRAQLCPAQGKGWGGAGDTAGGSPAPRPLPEPFTCRRASSSSMARSGHAAALLTGPAPEAPAPPPRLSKLETSREAAPGRRDRAPPPEVRGPPGPGLSAAPRPRQVGSRGSTPEPEATAPAPAPRLPPLRPQLPLGDTEPRPGTGGQEGASPGLEFPGRSAPPRAERGGSEQPAPPADRGRCGAAGPLRAGHLLFPRSPHGLAPPLSVFLSEVVGVTRANPKPAPRDLGASGYLKPERSEASPERSRSKPQGNEPKRPLCLHPWPTWSFPVQPEPLSPLPPCPEKPT